MSMWSVSVLALSVLVLSTALDAAPSAVSQPASKQAATPQTSAKKTESFKPFTGRVAANKVRLRVQPDLESHIFRQVSKNDLLLIVGEEGDFYAVQPPKDAKAYVFRSYILDNVVEASRVNVRLEPHVDGPIIGQLQAGDKVQGQVCAMNHKWMEIAPPPSTRFFVSKEFIVNAGGPDFLASMEKKKSQVEELLNHALLGAESENKKTYEEMSPQPVIEQFQTIVRNFSDFPEAVARAKEALAQFKDSYLNKKIAYLEAKAQLSSHVKDEMLARHKAEKQELLAAQPRATPKRSSNKEMSETMRFWDGLEESLYLSWTAFHAGRKMEDFYAEQKANASVLTGTLETYDFPVKNRPGDYILRGENAPLAYLYSTSVDLEKYVGKEVTIQVSPRPNNHFAFPAYFVLSVE